MTHPNRAERLRLYYALYLVCMDWHSGQDSRGYRLLGRCLRAILRLNGGYFCLTPEMRAWPEVKALATAYGAKL